MAWPAASLCKECVSFEGNAQSAKQPTRKSAAAPDWGWFCPDCVKKRGAELVSLDIKVWWLQDAVYYEGRIDAFDAFSGTHRIQYVDGEWEFVDLRFEPFIVRATEFPGRQKRSLSDKSEPSSAKKVKIDLSVDASPCTKPSTNANAGTSSSSRSSRSSDLSTTPSVSPARAASSHTRSSGSGSQDKARTAENKGTLLQFFGEPKKTRSSSSK
jgi:hypothetical protein